MTGSGPLQGLRIIEMAGLGPAPLAGQLLADLGAEVISVDRKSGAADPTDINRRNKRSVAFNLKSADGAEACQRLIASADVLIEGFRPGVMERLQLGPKEMLAINPKLIYARMTGWGQTGPWAHLAGHDINYISLSGALHAIGTRDSGPVPPLNLVGDYGGGAMFLIFGILAGIIERQNSGRGQVVDAAMVDGVAALMSVFNMMNARKEWIDQREANLLDGGAPFYRCYETADGKAMAVGPIEPQFYAEFCSRLGVPCHPASVRNDRGMWPILRDQLAAAFRQKTRGEWAAIFDGSDACVTEVLTLAESEKHPHLKSRGTYFRGPDGVTQPAPAPRFARTPAPQPKPPSAPGADTDQVLAQLGYTPDKITALRKDGVLA